MTRIAIIAVHGVGSPPQFATARGIADLLTQYGCASERCSYASFTEQLIKIPTSPLVVPPDAGGRPREAADARPSFSMRLKHLRPRDRDRTVFEEGDRTSETDLDVAFMRDQLAGYEAASPRLPYDTIEIVGSRAHGPAGVPRTEQEIRIYEMYWADLSRVGNGLVRILGAVYQLILHIAHLGRKTLDLGAAAAARRPKAEHEVTLWRRVSFWHAWALRFFTVGVPVFTLLLLGCVLLFLPDAIAPRKRLIIGVTLIELALLVGIGVRAYFRERARHAAGRLVGYILAFVLLGIAVIVFADRLGGSALGIALLNVVSVTLVLLTYLAIVNRYDTAAPGALPWGIVGLGVVLGGMVGWGPRFARAAGSAGGEWLRYVAFAGFQFSYVLLIIVWLLIWGSAAATSWYAIRLRYALRRAAIAPHETRLRAKRAIWTAKVTLTLSLFGLLVASLVGYESVNLLAWKIHGAPAADTSMRGAPAAVPSGFNIYPTLPADHSLPLISMAIVRPDTVCAPPAGIPYDPAYCAKHFFDALIAQSGTSGLPVALGAAGLSLLLVSWFVVLVAITSIHVPASESAYARNVGDWVTDGLTWVHTAGTVLVLGLALGLSIGLADAAWKLTTTHAPTWLSGLGTQRTSELLVTLALVLLASSATLATLRVRLELLASRARPAIGILLDVDNYLRESPPDDTPRARMAERFSSLLRHVVDRRDADGRPYFDRVVVVSHSQGTVIAADLLRFLTIAQVKSPDIANVDVRLITMGSPLRQLYAAHFPHLYDWIDRTDDFGDGRRPDDDTAAAARSFVAQPLVPPPAALEATLNELSPSPSWLRVRQWVNLFTAGDYVGRPLWQTDHTRDIWKYDPHDRPAVGLGRRERCLGDGTHTRYWTSLDVAREIDDVVSA